MIRDLGTNQPTLVTGSSVEDITLSKFKLVKGKVTNFENDKKMMKTQLIFLYSSLKTVPILFMYQSFFCSTIYVASYVPILPDVTIFKTLTNLS